MRSGERWTTHDTANAWHITLTLHRTTRPPNNASHRGKPLYRNKRVRSASTSRARHHQASPTGAIDRSAEDGRESTDDTDDTYDTRRLKNPTLAVWSIEPSTLIATDDYRRIIAVTIPAEHTLRSRRVHLDDINEVEDDSSFAPQVQVQIPEADVEVNDARSMARLRTTPVR